MELKSCGIQLALKFIRFNNDFLLFCFFMWIKYQDQSRSSSTDAKPLWGGDDRNTITTMEKNFLTIFLYCQYIFIVLIICYVYLMFDSAIFATSWHGAEFNCTQFTDEFNVHGSAETSHRPALGLASKGSLFIFFESDIKSRQQSRGKSGWLRAIRHRHIVPLFILYFIFLRFVVVVLRWWWYLLLP